MPPSIRCPCLLAVSLLTMAAAPAQQVRALAPIGAIAAPPLSTDDAGIPVEMFENPNLDRYLRRAQDFLGREDYAAAIQVLQDVVEGKTIEVVGAPAERAAGAEPTDGPVPGADGARSAFGRAGEAGKAPTPVELDARQSVFSQDGRLYRPVRRLCHELLAQLPSIGVDLYRAAYEVAAAEMLEQAIADGSVGALEAVANRYFITLPAGRAMVVLADRLMHEGRYRAAVQVLRDLVEVYPAENRTRLGITEAWCGFKMALSLRLAGEVGAAHDVAVALAAKHPDETLRILGELQAVKDLPVSSLFADEVLALIRAPTVPSGPSWLLATTEELVPLWQYRFTNPDPYREPKAGNDDNSARFFGEGSRPTLMPHAGRYGGGTLVTFSADRSSPQALPKAVFLEHFRLRIADAASGIMLAQSPAGAATDQIDEPPKPRENHPRVRIAASDFALLRPVEDEGRRYVVLGHKEKTTISTEALKSSHLIAYARDTLQPVWSSTDWLDGTDGLRDVTFLAAPTIFGERLLLPSLRRGAYSLECLDRTTGRPLWHTPLHAGGTLFWKAPGTPVVVHAGTAFVATNAGCIAAVDAFAGDLRWIRRYERTDPVRPVRRTKSSGQREAMQFGQQFAQGELPGFLPNDLMVQDGLVIVAGCDSDVILCLDGASGKPVWIVDAATRYAPYGRLRTLVGMSRDNLFATADKHLVCIGLEGGLVRWSRELPTVITAARHATRGRGVVCGEWVVVPSDREVLVFDVDGQLPMRRIALPSFDPGREPLGGACMLASHGPWLAVGYSGGVEVFSSTTALQALATTTVDPLRKAGFLVQANKTAAAEEVLARALRDEKPPAERRAAAAATLLSLVRERAAALARAGNLPGAMTALDGIADLLVDHDVRLQWHLARLEICKDVADLRAHEREQQRLYDFMEGKG